MPDGRVLSPTKLRREIRYYEGLCVRAETRDRRIVAERKLRELRQMLSRVNQVKEGRRE